MRKILFALLFVSLSISALGQESRSPRPLEDLNVDFMMRGYFYAGSKIKDEAAFGGFGTSDNFPKEIGPGMDVRRGEVFLVAMPEEEVAFGEKYKGMKVLLFNATKERVSFLASDSRLYIVQEALDRDGLWKPVEYLPASWCGNSYHRVLLGPYEYWEFAAARYHGRFKTKLRFRLDERKSETETVTIYSNTFEGGVNPKQFTVRQGHQATSIMDPYDN
jgi:hypothetical protein